MVNIFLLLLIRYTSSDMNHDHNQDIVYFQSYTSLLVVSSQTVAVALMFGMEIRS
jgi:hypothetical protein